MTALVSPPFHLRRAVRADASELARLLAPLGFPLTRERVEAVWDAWEAEGNLALVAPGETGLLGAITLHRMVVLHRDRPVGRITALAVDPVVRGRGLGRALVQAAAEELARAGCSLLEVTSHRRHEGAHAFYRHVGFEETSRRFALRLE